MYTPLDKESMTDSEIQRLVSMLNDISANLASYPDAGLRTADHIKRFWTPRMIVMLRQYVADGGAGLSTNSQQAVGCLQDAS